MLLVPELTHFLKSNRASVKYANFFRNKVYGKLNVVSKTWWDLFSWVSRCLSSCKCC